MTDEVDLLMDTYRTGRSVRDGDVDVDQTRFEGNVPELRGTIEIGHMRGTHDHYGGRGGSGGALKHMGNTNPPERGWLGNPYEMDEKTVAERRRVIAHYLRDFCVRMRNDPEFHRAVKGLRGQRVACWCRGISQDRNPTNWCHLDVVAHYLEGDLRPVFDYLRGAETDQ